MAKRTNREALLSLLTFIGGISGGAIAMDLLYRYSSTLYFAISIPLAIIATILLFFVFKYNGED
jgi:uncharacterized membrane protein YsdA (DUF1294 family)